MIPKGSLWSAALLLVVVVALVNKVRGDYRLEVRLDRYQNRRHLQADGTCCDVNEQLPPCIKPCINWFTFCIQSTEARFDANDLEVEGHRHSDTDVCPESSETYVTGIVGKHERDPDDLNFENKSVIDSIHAVPNPLVIVSSGSWPEKFQIVIVIKNWDIFAESLVDYYVIQDWKLHAEDGQFTTRNLVGRYHSSLMISARVICVNNTVGRICNQKYDPVLHTVAYNETLEPEEVLAQESNNNSTSTFPDSKTVRGHIDSDHDELVIGLSVMGSIFGLLILTIFVSLLCYTFKSLWKKAREDYSQDKSEREPFLRENQNEPSHKASSTEDEGKDYRAKRTKITHGSHSNRSGSIDPDEFTNTDISTEHLQLLSDRTKACETGTYSIIRREYMEGSTSESLDEINCIQHGDLDSGYSIITKESMEEYISEDLSDVEEVEEEEEEEMGDSENKKHVKKEGINETEVVVEKKEDGEVEEEEVVADGNESYLSERPRMPSPVAED